MYASDLFKGKIVLVTGGGSGIGLSIAEYFLKYGAKVIIASRNEAKLKTACDNLSQFGECSFAVCDIRDVQSVKSLNAFIKEKYQVLDILINNAGGQFPSLAEDISEKGWNAVINNNLNGTWNMIQQTALSFFIPQSHGIIVNIIVNISRGFPGMAHTAAARAGVDNLTKTLAVEWSKHHIRINAIAPGIIDSTGLEQYPEELKTGISETIPLQRLGKISEVADTVLFLSSPMASYIQGETLYVDGGQRLWGDIFKI
jgi:citronellol/citronellal dehydrogenase